MVSQDVIKKVHTAIKKVWTDDLSIDYDQSYILKEDSLKSAFYFHLRKRLGDSFLNNNNLRLFTEYKIDNNRIDLVIVEIDPESTETYLADCVTEVLVAVEMKYKDANTSESIFYQDILKIFSYLDTWGSNTKHYFAFVQERYFKATEITNWIEDEQAAQAHKKITELYAYWDEDIDETIWKVVDY